MDMSVLFVAEPTDEQATFRQEEFVEDAARQIIEQEPNTEFSAEIRTWLSERERIRRSVPPLPPRHQWEVQSGWCPLSFLELLEF